MYIYIIQGAITYIYIIHIQDVFSTSSCLSMFALPGSFSVFVTLSSSIITCKPGFKGRQGGSGCRADMSLAKWPAEPPNSQNDLQDSWNRLRPSCYVPEPPPFILYASQFGFRGPEAILRIRRLGSHCAGLMTALHPLPPSAILPGVRTLQIQIISSLMLFIRN